ncbi:MAG: hypothetical protein MUE36_04660 [Acidimicrobiales bacterium]|jgi:hypothetical protein|nr:hypothetical protein [Acidimicrobiales bacterium]
MDHRQLARSLAALRTVIGVALLVAPGTTGGLWLGSRPLDRRARLLVRGLGARDLALGIGTLRALDEGAPVRPWVTMSMVGDVADVVAATGAARTLGAARTALTVAAAGGGAALGAVAASGID